MDTSAIIGNKIRELRDLRGWTQLQLGNKFQPPKDSTLISRWERGKVTPSAENIAELAKIFNVSTEVFLSMQQRQTCQAC